MESLNLNMLASSLPNSNLANAEKDLMNNFKAAALSLTTLYRSSRRTSKRAYNAGYAAACQDLLLMIQQGVSAGESSSDPNGTGGMSIGRVMDYVEARLEAIKSREDEEDEDEERERKDKDRSNAGHSQSAAAASTNHRSGADPSASTKSTTAPVPEHKSTKDTVRLFFIHFSRASMLIYSLTPLTPHTPPSFSHHQHHAPPLPFVPPSPTPSTSSLASPLHITTSLNPAHMKAAKLSALTPLNRDIIAPSSAHAFAFANGNATGMHSVVDTLDSVSVLPDLLVAGTKRRHTAMLVDSSSPTDATSSNGALAAHGSTRRRTRSSRGAMMGAGGVIGGVQDQNVTSRGGEAMDVEEEGRERKGVARR
ncbi:hypothetical protein EUX98_g7117 [Antrodiella citrinella]|uniref:Uncharacterized protein n=1 Tax=Antrodiella citrinella TaxID=2447956 RepID=A0A4S4MP45_9APHY|nr:hypothetical protein EUX98_g7117 [Antrodiella citrinella]